MDPTPEGSIDRGFETAWREHRGYVLDVAYRMLGSMSEAEDVVQETFARFLRTTPGQVEDARGWLTVVATRLCLDQLRSARTRHEAYVGPWLPDPVIEAQSDDPDPADRVTLDDSVRMALLLVLERLNPAERAAFVLHDVFGFSFDDVAKVVGRSSQASRQLASRARRRIQAETEPARFEVDPAELRHIAERFIEAATTGSSEALMDVLDPDVVGWTDGGGFVPAPQQAVAGSEHVAETFLRFMRAFRVRMRPMVVNAEPGMLLFRDDRLIGVTVFEVREGLIARIHGIANPQKIAYVASLIGVPAGPA